MGVEEDAEVNGHILEEEGFLWIPMVLGVLRVENFVQLFLHAVVLYSILMISSMLPTVWQKVAEEVLGATAYLDVY